MKNKFSLISAVLITLTLSFSGVPDVEAKRFGGGKSFGSKNYYSSPYRRNSKTSSQRTAKQQKANQHNQAARDRMSRRGGFMGLLGGLALGGLLGSLFFGGAFEGMNFMDILVFGGIAYLLFRLFAARSRQGHAQAAGYQRQYGDGYQFDRSHNRPREQSNQGFQDDDGFDTDVMFDKNNASIQQDVSQAAETEQKHLPAGFDEWDFMNGAENAFRMLQKAWDEKDLTSIRSMTTDQVFADIQQQLNDSTEAHQTDILKLNSELLEVRDFGGEMEAVVLFDCILRENVEAQSAQVREVWHFVKTRNSLQQGWQLDGIQQLED